MTCLGASLEVGRPSQQYTPFYAAPEQLADRACSTAVDTFAARKVLFELLTRGKNTLENGEIGREREISSYFNHLPTFVREKVAFLIGQTTKRRAQDRISCSELADQLDDLFSLYLDPPVWRAIQSVEAMAQRTGADDGAVSKAELLEAIVDGLKQARGGKRRGVQLRREAKGLLTSATSAGIFVSAGYNLVRIA